MKSHDRNQRHESSRTSTAALHALTAIAGRCKLHNRCLQIYIFHLSDFLLCQGAIRHTALCFRTKYQTGSSSSMPCTLNTSCPSLDSNYLGLFSISVPKATPRLQSSEYLVCPSFESPCPTSSQSARLSYFRRRITPCMYALAFPRLLARHVFVPRRSVPRPSRATFLRYPVYGACISRHTHTHTLSPDG
jgi:hypothetical protein